MGRVEVGFTIVLAEDLPILSSVSLMLSIDNRGGRLLSLGVRVAIWGMRVRVGVEVS